MYCLKYEYITIVCELPVLTFHAKHFGPDSSQCTGHVSFARGVRDASYVCDELPFCLQTTKSVGNKEIMTITTLSHLQRLGNLSIQF